MDALTSDWCLPRDLGVGRGISRLVGLPGRPDQLLLANSYPSTRSSGTLLAVERNCVLSLQFVVILERKERAINPAFLPLSPWE